MMRRAESIVISQSMLEMSRSTDCTLDSGYATRSGRRTQRARPSLSVIPAEQPRASPGVRGPESITTAIEDEVTRFQTPWGWGYRFRARADKSARPGMTQSFIIPDISQL